MAINKGKLAVKNGQHTDLMNCKPYSDLFYKYKTIIIIDYGKYETKFIPFKNDRWNTLNAKIVSKLRNYI